MIDKSKKTNKYRLKDCCIVITDGDHQPPPKVDKGIPFITITNITNNNEIDFNDVMYVPQDYYNKIANERKVRKNDILYSVVGSYGTAVMIDYEKEFVFQRHIAMIRPNPDIILPKYLYHLMCSKSFYKKAEKMAVGAAQKTISLDALRNMKIDIPCLENQKEIVDVIDMLEQYQVLISKLVLESINKKKWLQRKLMLGEVRLPGYTKEWKKSSLGMVLTERKEYAIKMDGYEHVTLSKEGITPKCGRYDREHLVKSDDKKYKVTYLNDICFNPANIKFGVICKNSYGTAMFSPIYVTLEVNDGYNADFMTQYVTRLDFINAARKYEEGTVYERMAVKVDDFLRLEVMLPEIEEQVEIAKMLDLADRETCLLQKKLNFVKREKEIVMQLLLGGII